MALVISEGFYNCSIFAITDEEQIFMGRNYDMYYRLKNYCESYFTNPKGGFKSVGQTDIFVGREDGVNEKGLGIAISGVPSYFKSGLVFWVTVRYLLDKCRTVREGFDLLSDIPHYSTITFLLVDPTGDMAVVEVSPTDYAIREPTNGYIISTNHFNHPDMQGIQIFEPPDSRIRYETILKYLSFKLILPKM